MAMGSISVDDQDEQRAKEEWGDTPSYKEYVKKSAFRSKEDEVNMRQTKRLIHSLDNRLPEKSVVLEHD